MYVWIIKKPNNIISWGISAQIAQVASKNCRLLLVLGICKGTCSHIWFAAISVIAKHLKAKSKVKLKNTRNGLSIRYLVS